METLDFLICSFSIPPFIIWSAIPLFPGSFPMEKIQKSGIAELGKQAEANDQHKIGGISVEFVHNFHIL